MRNGGRDFVLTEAGKPELNWLSAPCRDHHGVASAQGGMPETELTPGQCETPSGQVQSLVAPTLIRHLYLVAQPPYSRGDIDKGPESCRGSPEHINLVPAE